MAGYGSIYGGYYGGRGPVRPNEAWMRPSWNTKYNGFGGYGGYGEDYNYAQVPGLSYNGAYGSYGGAYGGYGLQGYGTVLPGYGGSLSPYGAGGPTYATTPPMMYPNYVANSATLPAQMQQPGASAAQSVSPLYPNNISGSQSNNPPITGIANPTGGWPPQ